MDIVADNIAKLKELFPEILAENKIDFKALQALLGKEIEVEDERYSFNWHGKAQARRLAQSPSTGTLRPCKEESVNWDSTQNLFIEGDNLEVLKLLQKSYHKQVKMIYIDPPYNTGSDFVYLDDFKDNIKNYLEVTKQKEGGRPLSPNSETSGRYHTDWLNMIYPRLKLARNLLADDGVIFISIDDYEMSNLRKICDEIFGEENSLTEAPSTFIWQKSGTTAGHLANAHEYVLCYAKNKRQLPFFKLEEYGDESIISHGALKKISKANPASEILFKAGMEFQGINAIFRGEIGGSERQIINGEMVFENGRLAHDVLITAGWAMKEQVLSWMDGKETYDTKGQKVLKFYFNKEGILWYEKERGTIHPKTILDKSLGTTKNGSAQIKEILGENPFDYPKPIELITFLSSFSTSGNDLILDFFAGSGTTGHAIYTQNAEDNCKRNFILVQLPEALDPNKDEQKLAANYCDSIKKHRNLAEITKERLRRSVLKIRSDNTDYQGDLGFKVFKLDSSNLKPWDADFDSLAQDLADATDVVKADRKPEDVLFEILLKYGLDLTLPIDMHTIAGKMVYEVGAGALIVCLDDGVTEAVAEGIGKLKEQLEPEVMRVVFKDSSFANDAAKVNAVQVLKQYGIDDVKSI